MKRKFSTKMLSLLLCGSMLLSLLTGCTNSKKNQLSWDVTEEEQILPFEMEMKENEENTTLVVTYSEDVFSSINKEQIKLTATTATTLDEEGEVADSAETTELTDYKIEVDNPKQLTLTVPKDEKDYISYYVAVHSSAISSGEYGEASVVDIQEVEEQIQYAAVISGEYATGSTNPVITVNLENTVAAAGLSKDMVKLTGLFEGLEITEVTGAESSIVIVTSGTVKSVAPFVAGVDLAAEATNSGTPLTAACDVVYRDKYVKQDSFVLAEGNLNFDVVLTNDTFNLAKGDTLTGDGVTYHVKSLSEDKTTVTLGITATSNDLDIAIDAVNGSMLEIPADKIASQTSQQVLISGNKADIGGFVDYLEAAEAPDTYNATAIVYVRNGDWNSELTASDITFEGDFQGATVTKVEKDGTVYQIAFTFTQEGVDLEDVNLNGSVTVATAKVKNTWGTSLETSSTELAYITGMDRGELYGSIAEFISANQSVFDTIKTVGTVASTASSVVGLVTTVLGMCGVVETTDAKLDNLKQQMENIQATLDEVNHKIDELGQSVVTGQADTQDAVYQNTYLTAHNGWNDFLNLYVLPLSEVRDSYAVAYDNYMLDFINRAGAGHSVMVFIDENGKVTAPGKISGYSMDQVKITQTAIGTTDKELSAVKQKVLKNKGRLYDGYWEDIIACEITMVDFSGNPIENVTAEQYFTAVQMDAAISALKKVDEEKIVTAYTNFCYALAGQAAGSSSLSSGLSPLDYYYQMMSVFYNFYSEAENDITTTQMWLASMLVQSSSLAMLAYEYDSAISQDKVTKAYDVAKKELQTINGNRNAKYCYVVGKTLSVDRVYGAHATDYLQHTAEVFLSTSKDKTSTNECKYTFPVAYMKSSEILVMRNRYIRLKDKGVSNSATFADYLVANNIIQSGLSEAKVITTSPKQEDINKDNSVTLTVTNTSYKSDYFKEGDKVPIGTDADEKKESQYYEYAIQLMADTVDFNGNVSRDRFSATAHYAETHFFWIHPESAFLEYKIDKPLLVFKLS